MLPHTNHRRSGFQFLCLMFGIACQSNTKPEFGIQNRENDTIAQNTDNYVIESLEFVPIPIGTFNMGSPEDQNGRQPHPDSDQSVESNETQFQVTLTHPYHMSTTEVTRGLFFQYIEDDGFGSANCLEDNCPIQFITWNMAAHFTNLLSEEEGLNQCYTCVGSGRDVECDSNFDGGQIYQCEGFRLPTEAEWENASRAGTTSAIWTPNGGAELPVGIEFDCGDHALSDGTYLATIAWFCGASDQAMPVAQLLPNDFGLYDMSGNVWEWVHDGYGPYPEGDRINHVGAPAPERSIRGGRWGNEPYAMRAAKRIHKEADFWDGNYGFRVAIASNSVP
jgi:formylglycine-generating enzyme required for sulfatase activity